MKIENKSISTVLVGLIPLPTIVVPLLAGMEPQMIFGLSNSFLSGFVGGSSIFGMIILLALSNRNQKAVNLK